VSDPHLAIINGQLDYTADPAGCDATFPLPWGTRVTPAALTEVLRLHRLWCVGAVSGRHANLTGANLTRANMTGADLTGANLRGATLRDADLTYTKLTCADLTYTKLTCADLTGANLRDATLRDADLTRADLRDADLSDANLTGATLTGANLTRADLRDADLSDANLTGATLTGADLSDANLTDATLTGANLPSPTMVLLASWGSLSPALTVDLMRYDAACHPDPARFDEWAVDDDGRCPYDGTSVQRAANFAESRELWREHGNGPCPRPYDLMTRVLGEKCPEWTDEQRKAFDARFPAQGV